MMSVLRVNSTTSDLDSLKVIREMLNDIRPDACVSGRPLHRGLTCSISDERLWHHQQTEILRFLEEFSPVIETFAAKGMEARIDVGVTNDDWRENAVVMCLITDPKFMGVLSKMNIEFEISFYGPTKVSFSRQKPRSARRSP